MMVQKLLLLGHKVNVKTSFITSKVGCIDLYEIVQWVKHLFQFRNHHKVNMVGLAVRTMLSTTLTRTVT